MTEPTLYDIATRPVVSVDVDAPLMDAARMMRDRDVGCLLVVEASGKLAGIVTDRDLVVRGVADGRDPTSTRVVDVATREVKAVHAEAALEEALALMSASGVRRLLLLDPVHHDAVVGIVSLSDLARCAISGTAVASAIAHLRQLEPTI